MTGSMPCIWMSAGLVAYKLCDREFACESCPFDAAMRGAKAAPAPAPELARARLDLPFPTDRTYHSGHVWVRSVGRERVRVGVDAFAAKLLRRIDGVILPPPGTPVRRDASICWLHDADEIASLRSPVTGRISVTHGLIRHRPELMSSDPYGEGWLFEIRVRKERPPKCNGGLLAADAASELARRQGEALATEVRAFATEATGLAGPTLADGGVPLDDPIAVLGRRRYYRIISAYLV